MTGYERSIENGEVTKGKVMGDKYGISRSPSPLKRGR
jgi:hypothetical protein